MLSLLLGLEVEPGETTQVLLAHCLVHLAGEEGYNHLALGSAVLMQACSGSIRPASAADSRWLPCGSSHGCSGQCWSTSPPSTSRSGGSCSQWGWGGLAPARGWRGEGGAPLGSVLSLGCAINEPHPPDKRNFFATSLASITPTTLTHFVPSIQQQWVGLFCSMVKWRTTTSSAVV